VLLGDFPGMASEDINIEFHEQMLTISGASGISAGTGKLRRCEFDRRSLERSFRIHEEINTDGISASFDNGALTVVLPLMPAPVPRSIPVTTR